MKKPLVIGHRGSSGEGPENTLASFALAIEQGCDGVELDIHVTLDGTLLSVMILDWTGPQTGKVLSPDSLWKKFEKRMRVPGFQEDLGERGSLF
ncbi:glycerophosphodiester phosphodiesterase family protein [Paenibacillus larvae]